MNTLREKEDQFFIDWKNEVEVNGKTFFVQDGTIDSSKYENSTLKIMSLMKETPFDSTASHGYVFGDGVSNQVKNKGRFHFRKGRDAIRILTGRLSCIREILEKNNPEFSYGDIKGENINKRTNIDYFLESAYVNIKKYNGLSRSNLKDLENVILRDREKLKFQINEILNPDIILCCMKIHYYKVINYRENEINLLVGDEQKMVNIFEEDLGNRKRLIIETYHPSYYKYPEELIINNLKNALLNLKK
ncbi:hypothetical protein [Aquiflexum sp.]|uniref:hypothetical protein n=1 Tax=Aquiflexum sp. TaxID=1872584 RepID=UPI00359402A7